MNLCSIQIHQGGTVIGVLIKVHVLKLNQYQNRNAFNKALVGEIRHHLKDIEKANPRCLVLASSIEGFFSTGADLTERLKLSNEETKEFVCSLRSLFNQIFFLPYPTLSAIDGYALGGGLEMALSTDIRICTKDSKLGLPETKLAIFPAYNF